MSGDDIPREEPCEAPALPGWLADQLCGYRWRRSNIGCSGGSVFRLTGKSGAPDLFLKHGTGSAAQDITDEMVRLRWLSRRIAVPEVTNFLAAGEEAWLVSSALPGRTAYELLCEDAAPTEVIVDALAAFLRRLHAIPTAECPFASDHLLRMVLAKARVEAGLVEEDDFDDARAGWSAAQVYAALEAHLPLTSDLVVTHGDYSLDNLLIENGLIVGCIDTGRVGVADRWQDLAIMWNCLEEFGKGAQTRFVATYGAALDFEKLEFHLLLDELF